MIILKIGGSILTEKDSAKPEVDYESLERIAGEIEDALYSEEMRNDLVDGLSLFMEQVPSAILLQKNTK